MRGSMAGACVHQRAPAGRNVIWFATLCVCVQLLAAPASAHFVAVAGGVEPTHTVALADIMAALPTSDSHIKVHDLPIVRPPGSVPACDYQCMRSLSLRRACGVDETCELGQTGVYTLELAYKPLAGVTSDMMVWLFQNLHRDTRLADGSTWPMYLVFHGTDHLHHEASPPGNVTLGTKFSWVELTLSGCSYDPASADAPWACPASRRGFVRADPASAWSSLFHTKVSMTVTRFDRSGMEFVRRETNPFFKGDMTRTVVTTRHEWADSPEGLQLTTKQFLGLMKAGSNDEFDTDTVVGPIANMIIKERYLDGARNVPAGNITAAGWMAALHYLQEYGSLSSWLPQAYRANNAVDPVPPAASDALLAVKVRAGR